MWHFLVGGKMIRQGGIALSTAILLPFEPEVNIRELEVIREPA
jgi:hypothetical protein